MKKNYLAIAVATFAFTLTACDSKSETGKVTDKTATSSSQASTTSAASPSTVEMKDISYMVGYGFGQNLEQTHVKGFDMSQMLAGLNDGMEGKDSKLTQEQTQAAMTQLQTVIQKTEIEQAKIYAVKGKEFLDSNAKREGVITTASGLQYEVVQKGTGAKPLKDDIVKVNYEGKLLDGKVFDSSIKRGQPAEFAVSAVIPGWVEALQLMQVGEKVKLYVPSELAYGVSGIPPVIPPNSVLVFDVELLEIKKPEAKPAEVKEPAKTNQSQSAPKGKK